MDGHDFVTIFFFRSEIVNIQRILINWLRIPETSIEGEKTLH